MAWQARLGAARLGKARQGVAESDGQGLRLLPVVSHLRSLAAAPKLLPMWTFWGLALIAGVLWFWLRRIRLALLGILAVTEASINRVARRTGEPPIMADVDSSVLR